MKGWRARIGFLVPPGNPTVEPEMMELAPPGVSLHFTRMNAEGPAGTHTGQEERNLSQVASVPDGVKLLSMVSPNVIVMAHTATSYTLGQGLEATLVERMEALSGARFVTAFGSVLEALAHLGARRIAYATPYSAEMTARGKHHLERCGLEVVSSGHLSNVRNIYEESLRHRPPGRSSGRRCDLPVRRRHAHARCIEATGRGYRQACDLGGIGHDVACLAHRGRTLPHRRLRPVARRRDVVFRAPRYPARSAKERRSDRQA
jgi:maleate cis-trans isomerase